MSNTFTLDALQDEVRKKYEPFKIVLEDGTSVELKPLIRLGSKARDTVVDAIKDINDIEVGDDEDEDDAADEYSQLICNAVTKIIRMVVSSPRKLLAQIDSEDDVRIRAEMYTEVLRRWTGSTQVGEAAP